MSPLAIMLMRILRAGLMAASLFVAAVIGIELWKNWNATQSFGFLGVLAAMLIGSLWLSRSISKELRNDQLPKK